MTKAEKTAVIEELKEKFSNSSFFYITDSSELTVEQVNKLRRMLFNKGIEMRVVKNTLVKKALESLTEQEDRGYADLMDVLTGPSAIMFTEVGNAPARVIEEFRKLNEKPTIKAAYIDSAVYVGDDQLKLLTKLKSKEELLGELIGLLQSPPKTVISQLQSGGQKIMGLLKTLEERGA